LDLILVEGFRNEAFCKIELHRAALNQPLLCWEDENIIAVASDVPLALPAKVQHLELNQPETLAEFIVNYFNLKEKL